MAMNQFEDLLERSVTNPNRLVNEVLQLENYIFRNPSFTVIEDEQKRVQKLLDSPINDLDEVLLWKRNQSHPYEPLTPFR